MDDQKRNDERALSDELYDALDALWTIAKDIPSVTRRDDLVTQVRQALARARAQ